jgi:anti-sigma-K factor RskA
VVEPIDDIERELREQLTARDAPEGFADRLMTRVAQEHRPCGRRRWFTLPGWRWLAATALAAAAAVGVGVQHEREQRREGEAARAQVMLALRITGTTLRDVERTINNQVGRQGGGTGTPDQKED